MAERRRSKAGVAALAPSSAWAWALVFAFASVSMEGCQKAGVDCVPPPAILICPEAGAPSFADDVYPIFERVCVSCHRAGGVEAKTPLTTYAQIYGKNGTEQWPILNQVFYSCLMPPSDAPELLTDTDRQTLLDWFACGAPDSPAVDGGGGD